MIRLLIGATAVLALAGCEKAPDHGRVSDMSFQPAWIQYLPGNTFCSGSNPPSCYTTPPQFIPYPDSWRVEVTSDDGKESGWGEVDHSTYNMCPRGSRWPDCGRRSV